MKLQKLQKLQKRVAVVVLSIFINQSCNTTGEKAAVNPDSKNYTEPQYGIEMIYVRGGSFAMGCTSGQGSDCDEDESPVHQVTVSDFYIGKYEVTQAQWKAVMGTDVRQLRSKSDTKWSVQGEGGNYPVYYVNWDDVWAFIHKLKEQTGKNYRLPTEAEWEYASRGGASSAHYKYSGSNNVNAVAWYAGNSGNSAHPVGGKQGNELGIYDMSGNVWEWCSDWWDNYRSNSQTNPTGPATGSGRVNRGGSWYTYKRDVRVSMRYRISPAARSVSLGFRLVCSLK